MLVYVWWCMWQTKCKFEWKKTKINQTWKNPKSHNSLLILNKSLNAGPQSCVKKKKGHKLPTIWGSVDRKFQMMVAVLRSVPAYEAWRTTFCPWITTTFVWGNWSWARRPNKRQEQCDMARLIKRDITETSCRSCWAAAQCIIETTRRRQQEMVETVCVDMMMKSML